MSYESDCNDFALYGDQQRDDADYEENARYDRWDGHREDMIGMDDADYYESTESDYHPDYFELGDDAGYRGVPCGADEFLLDDCDDEQYRAGYAAGRARRKSEDTDIPF